MSNPEDDPFRGLQTIQAALGEAARRQAARVVERVAG